jgi:hypothetical protein
VPFYEIVYETGNVSVAEYADDAEAFAGAGAQDERAKSGGQAGPQGGPAERVAKIYKYEVHPNDYNPEQTASADVLKSEVDALIEGLKDANGVVSIDQLTLEVRGLSHPMVQKEHPFDSQFKMEHEAELTLPGSDAPEEPPASGGSK